MRPYFGEGSVSVCGVSCALSHSPRRPPLAGAPAACPRPLTRPPWLWAPRLRTSVCRPGCGRARCPCWEPGCERAHGTFTPRGLAARGGADTARWLPSARQSASLRTGAGGPPGAPQVLDGKSSRAHVGPESRAVRPGRECRARRALRSAACCRACVTPPRTDWPHARQCHRLRRGKRPAAGACSGSLPPCGPVLLSTTSTVVEDMSLTEECLVSVTQA